MALKASSVLAVAAADSLSLTWSDCGAKHAVTTDVQPSSLTLGTDTAITGTGNLDKAVSGGTYDMELKAGGGLIDQHFTGNNCEAKSFDLPLGIGKLSWDGISCPLAAADSVKIGFHTLLASSLPAAIATSDIHLAANDQDSESVLCVDLHLAKQEELEVAADSLSLTRSDCGAEHATTTDVQPSALALGQDTAITGTGKLDKEVSGGTYDMELKAGGGLIDSHFTGNNCEAKSFDLPLGLGKLSWDGISCPLAAADSVKIGFHTTLAASLPPALATSDIHLAAQDQDSESVLCVDLHLAKQVSFQV
jgi:hypothetical protein